MAPIASSGKPALAIIAPGAMGSAVAHRLTSSGLTVYTLLAGRSPATRKRAEEAGMVDAGSMEALVEKVDWILSILPPSEAMNLAKAFRDAYLSSSTQKRMVYADCNAVSPETVKSIAALFQTEARKELEDVKFLDAGIIGGPPQGTYDPTFYASVHPDNVDVLSEFEGLSKYGLKVTPLRGEGSGIGDASALKMSYAGISKGITGLCTTMVLAAHASSPATASALLDELSISQPLILKRMTTSIPSMLPKAYRWVGEMEEISAFVASGSRNTGATTSGEEQIHLGMSSTYSRIEKSLNGENGGKDVEVLKKFVQDAKEKTR